MAIKYFNLKVQIQMTPISKLTGTGVTTHNDTASHRDRDKTRNTILLFLMGLGSATQVQLVGYLAIVEIFYAILTIYYIFTRWSALRRSGLWPFLVMISGWFLSALVTDIYRNTEMGLALKGCTTPLLWASALISMYFLLRDNGVPLVKWFVLGAALSGVISLYIFKPGSIIGLGGGSDVDYTYRILIGNITTFVWALPNRGGNEYFEKCKKEAPDSYQFMVS